MNKMNHNSSFYACKCAVDYLQLCNACSYGAA